jgi:hypothetical protein
LARSAPVEVSIASSAGPPSGTPPVAHGYTKRVLASEAAIVELPASFDDDLPSAAFSVLAGPAQATVLGGSGPYRILRPDPGASGSDALSFQVTTPSGTSAVATVTILYEDPVACVDPSSYCASSPNSVGPGAVMRSLGSPSFGANDLQLYA